MARPAIRIALIDQLGKQGCHRENRVGESFDFDMERGRPCPMVIHVAFPYVNILCYGGTTPGQPVGTTAFYCLDVDTANVFRIEASNGAVDLGQLRKSFTSPIVRPV